MVKVLGCLDQWQSNDDGGSASACGLSVTRFLKFDLHCKRDDMQASGVEIAAEPSPSGHTPITVLARPVTGTECRSCLQMCHGH